MYCRGGGKMRWVCARGVWVRVLYDIDTPLLECSLQATHLGAIRGLRAQAIEKLSKMQATYWIFGVS